MCPFVDLVRKQNPDHPKNDKGKHFRRSFQPNDRRDKNSERCDSVITICFKKSMSRHFFLIDVVDAKIPDKHLAKKWRLRCPPCIHPPMNKPGSKVCC